MNILKIKDPQGNWVDIPALKGDKGDKGDPGISPTIDSTLSQANQAADAKAVGDKIDEITLTIDDTLTQSGQVADAKVTGDALNTKADQNGYYENLNVGVADQLASKNYIEDNEAYIFRPTGSGAKVGTREFDTIVGGSIVWNQLIGNDVKAANKVFDTATSTYQYYLTSATLSIKSGHKYLLTINGSRTISDNDAVNFSLMITGNNELTGVAFANGEADGVKSIIFTSSNDYNQSIGIVANNYYGKRGYSIEDSVSYDNLQLFDLTAMFGSTIADHIYSLEQAETGAGVAWFRKYFSNDYYEYNADELMHVTDLQSHDTVGFNLFDKSKAVVGKYMSSGNGTEATGNNFFHTEYIKAVPDTVYYISDTSASSNTSVFANYDSNKNFIGFSSKHNGNSNLRKTFSNTAYIVVNAVKTVLDTFCINLSWSGTRDGKYESYVKHSYPLDSSLTLRGIPKLTADGDLSYDGDIYKPDGTVERRYGIVDLGTLDWGKTNGGINQEGGYVFTTTSLIFAAAPVFCTKYLYGRSASSNNSAFSAGNLTISRNSSGTKLFIRDDSFADASSDDFEVAMSGVILIYELATPTTETAQLYQSPQIIDPYGTEEYVTTSIIPVGHQTQYPEDLRAKIESLPWDFANLIAPVEATYKATQNYTTGSLFIIDNILYKTTANIANGGTITPNTNCTATTLAEIIAAL